MKAIRTISLDISIVQSEGYRELVRQDKLSSLINQFLKENLNVKEISESKDKIELERQLASFQGKSALLQNKINEINEVQDKKKKEMEAKGFKWDKDLEGWFKDLPSFRDFRG